MPHPRAAVILAAGLGTRMKSAVPKCAHAIAGRPMVQWAIDLARQSGADRIVTVYGRKSPQIDVLARAAGTETAMQDPPLGTGHAVRAAEDALKGFDGDVIVLYGDTPLIRPETVSRVFEALEGGAAIAVLGFEPDEPGAYGRLITNDAGELEKIVEFKDASEAERAVRLVNSGVMAGNAKLMFELLAEVTNDNANEEYYLTDIVGLARKRGLKAAAVSGDAGEVLGVNSRADLAEAEACWQARKRADVMAGGATLIAPGTVWFSFDTEVRRDVVIEPNVFFGPGVTIADNVVIHGFSHLEGCVVREGAHVGPFVRLRPATDIGANAKVGNFVEIKKSQIGEGAKASHLSYIGDADVGANANIGAGTITCNYDGYNKNTTVIGEGAFIGSNSSLVAPVTIGDGAYTGSGSVITEDVPADALALGRAKQTNKEGWADRFRTAMSKRKGNR